jgi:RNA-directed DNA polymerase
LILSSANEKVSDGKVLRPIDSSLKPGIAGKGKFEPTEKGSPQGGIISPLLTNIYLNKFDQQMKPLGIRIVRYADGILIFAASKSGSGRYRAIATKYLEEGLKLTVTQGKTGMGLLSCF